MRSTARHAGLLCVILASLAVPAAAAGQDRGTFRSMDRNRDGVISRNEWPGTDESFRERDVNGDLVLTRAELRQAVGTSGTTTTAALGFEFLDYDSSGTVTAQEWMRAFNGLDTDGDGVLTEDELTVRAAAPATPRESDTPSFRAGRERGLFDGRQAGREDKARGTWDLEGQRELEQADAGYSANLGARASYQAGYRDGFRQGYSEGYGPRR